MNHSNEQYYDDDGHQQSLDMFERLTPWYWEMYRSYQLAKYNPLMWLFSFRTIRKRRQHMLFHSDMVSTVLAKTIQYEEFIHSDEPFSEDSVRIIHDFVEIYNKIEKRRNKWI